jgi:hypothetical protein
MVAAANAPLDRRYLSARAVARGFGDDSPTLLRSLTRCGAVTIDGGGPAVGCISGLLGGEIDVVAIDMEFLRVAIGGALLLDRPDERPPDDDNDSVAATSPDDDGDATPDDGDDDDDDDDDDNDAEAAVVWMVERVVTLGECGVSVRMRDSDSDEISPGS